MGICRFTLTDPDGNVILDGVTEQEFKKYLALASGTEQKRLGASRIVGEAIKPETFEEYEDVSEADAENQLRESIRTPLRNKQKLDKLSKSKFSLFMTRFFESQYGVLKTIRKKLGDYGAIVEATLKNRKGYNGLSSIVARMSNNEIFNDLKIAPTLKVAGENISERDLFDIFLNLNRIIKIDGRIKDKFYRFMSLRDKIKNDKSLSNEEKSNIKEEIDELKEYLGENGVKVLIYKNGDYSLGQYIHSQNKTAKSSRGELNRIKKLYPEIYKKFEKKAQSYYDSYKNLLYIQYKNNLISKNVYDELFAYDYVPSRYIDYIIEDEMSETNSKTASKLSNTIQKLTGGSDSDVLTNFQAILELSTANTYRRVFENRASVSLAKSIEEYPVSKSKSKELIKATDAKINPKGVQDMPLDMYIDKPIGFNKYGEPKYGDIPSSMDVIYFYRENGKRERIVAPVDFVEIWYDRNRLLTPIGNKAISWLSWVSFTNVFRSLITKHNPSFAIFQITLDAPQAIIATNVYPDLFLGSIMLAKDYASISKDIVDFVRSDKLSPLFKEAVDAGIFSDFLSSEVDLLQFSVTMNTSDSYSVSNVVKLLKARAARAANNTLESIAKMNEGVEYATRLAVYKRSKENYTKQYLEDNDGKPLTADQEFSVKQLAAYQARRIVDFSSSGTWVRAINPMFAYLNAAIQVFYSAARGIKNNPTRATLILTEIGVAGVSLLAYSLGDLGDDEEEKKKRLDEYLSLPDYQKNNYFNIYNPYTKEGSSYRWIRIYKPQPFRGYLNMLEQGYLKVAKKIDISPAQIANSFNDDLPIDLLPLDILTRNPLINAIIKYSWNYDAYRKERVYKNEEKVENWAEYDKSTGEIYKKAGELTKGIFGSEGISPKRAEAAVQSIIGNPEKNTTTAFIDKAGRILYYGAMNDKEGLKNELPTPGEEADWLFKLSGLKGRLFTKTPEINFELVDKLKEEEKKRFTQNKFIREQVDEIFTNEKDRKEALKQASTMLDELVKNGDLKPDAKKRILDIQDKRDFIKGKPRFYGDILYAQSNDIKTTILDYETENMDEKQFEKVLYDLRLNNIISKEVVNKVRFNRYARVKKK